MGQNSVRLTLAFFSAGTGDPSSIWKCSWHSQDKGSANCYWDEGKQLHIGSSRLFSGKWVFIWKVALPVIIYICQSSNLSVFILYYFGFFYYWSFKRELLHDTIETSLLSVCSSIYRFISVNQESIVLKGWEWWINRFSWDVGYVPFIVSMFEILLCICVNKDSSLQTQNSLEEWVI